MRKCLILGLVLLACCSCVSSRRMMRSMPFSRDGAQSGVESDRINLWPALYHAGDTTSVLWPLTDFDRDGFAIRPIVAKDGPEWSFLFPLAGWSTAEADGWFANAYWYESGGDVSGGIFPFMHFGDDFSFGGPFWWTDSTIGLFPLACVSDDWGYATLVWWNKGSFGLFPVAKTGVGLDYVGPFWWDDGDFGLFPLAMYGDGLSYVGPVWWGNDSHGLFPLYWNFDELKILGTAWWHDKKNFGLWPLAGRSEDLFSHIGPAWWTDTGFGLFPLADKWDDFWHIGPVWRENGSGNNDAFGVFPLYQHRKRSTYLFPFYHRWGEGNQLERRFLFGIAGGSKHDGPDNYFRWAPPLWLQRRTPDSNLMLTMPFFLYSRKADSSIAVTPLGGYGWNAEGKTEMLNILGPLFHHYRDPKADSSYTSFLWPLFGSRQGDEFSYQHALPVFARYQDQKREFWATPFTLRWRENVDDGFRFFNVLGPVFNHYEYPRTGASGTSVLWPLVHFGGNRKNYSSFAFPFYYFNRSEGAQRTLITPLGGAQWSSADKSYALDILGPVYYRSRNHDGTRSKQAILFPFWTQSEGPDCGSRTLLPAFHYSWEGIERLVLSPLGATGWDTDGNQRMVNVLGLLSHYERDDARERISFDVLWPIFHQEQQKKSSKGRLLGIYDYTQRPDRTDLSYFLWLGRYQRNEQRTDWRFFPFMNGSKQGEEEKDFKLLFGLLANYEKQVGKSHFSVLGYLFRRQQEGDRIARDIFPGISYDTGPDQTHFSFLWRVFSYARKGDRSGGHILFIPFGEQG